MRSEVTSCWTTPCLLDSTSQRQVASHVLLCGVGLDFHFYCGDTSVLASPSKIKSKTPFSCLDGNVCNFNLGGSGQRTSLPHYHSCPSYTIIQLPRCKITLTPRLQNKINRCAAQCKTRLRPNTLGCRENQDGCAFICKYHLSIQLQNEQF